MLMCFFGSVFFVFLVYAVVVMSFLGAEFIRLFTIRANRSCMIQEKLFKQIKLFSGLTSPVQLSLYLLLLRHIREILNFLPSGIVLY